MSGRVVPAHPSPRRSGEQPCPIRIASSSSAPGRPAWAPPTGWPSSATSDWDIYEAADHVGGLASSYRDPHGFIWDHGGHVMFSHYTYFDELVEKMLARRLRPAHARGVGVDARPVRAVPVPEQHPPPAARRVPRLHHGHHRGPAAADRPATNFDQWISAVFGEGIARHFMRAVQLQGVGPPAGDDGHVNGRATVCRTSTCAASCRTSSTTATTSAGARTTSSSSRCSAPGCCTSGSPRPCPSRSSSQQGAASDRHRRRSVVTFADGYATDYDQLVTTMPLTELVKRHRRLPRRGRSTPRATSTTRQGCSSASASPIRARARSAGCTSPASDSPFYRVTYLSNYSPQMTPGPGPLLAARRGVGVAVQAGGPRRPSSTARSRGWCACELLTPEQADRQDREPAAAAGALLVPRADARARSARWPSSSRG